MEIGNIYACVVQWLYGKRYTDILKIISMRAYTSQVTFLKNLSFLTARNENLARSNSRFLEDEKSCKASFGQNK